MDTTSQYDLHTKCVAFLDKHSSTRRPGPDFAADLLVITGQKDRMGRWDPHPLSFADSRYRRLAHAIAIRLKGSIDGLFKEAVDANELNKAALKLIAELEQKKSSLQREELVRLARNLQKEFAQVEKHSQVMNTWTLWINQLIRKLGIVDKRFRVKHGPSMGGI